MGAIGAEVPQFVDLMLAKGLTEEERNYFLSVLENLDAKSREIYDENFIDVA